MILSIFIITLSLGLLLIGMFAVVTQITIANQLSPATRALKAPANCSRKPYRT